MYLYGTKTFTMRSTPAYLLAAILSWACLNIQAQTDSMSVQLEDIIVSENRMELPFSQISRSIQLLTSREIGRLPAISVAELLGYVPGIDVRQRGPHGVQADISIRGGSFDQSLVLVNGIKLNDPQTGHHIMNLPLDVNQIERIEVLKGAGARIYGQNAFSGAINIVTKQSDRPLLEVALTGGSHQLGGIHIGASLPGSGMHHQVSFSRDFSQGYRHNTDYDITHAFYQGVVPGQQGQFQIMGGFSERRFGANGFYASPAFTEQYEEVQTSLLAVEYKTTRGRWVFKPRAYWRRNQDEYIFIRRNPAAYRNLHIGNTYGVEGHAQNANRWGISGIGVEASQVGLASNNLGTRSRTVLATFAEHRFLFLQDRLDLTPGISYTYFSDFGSRFFPGLDAGLSLHPRWKLFGNVGQTYRVPTFTDLYYEDPANAGNPELQPESSISWEGGIKYRSRQWYSQVAWFHRQGRDLIDWIREADTLRWQPRNFQQLDMRGLDASMDWHRERSLVRHVRVGYTLVEADLQQSETVLSRYVLNHLRHQVMAGVDLVYGPLTLNVQGRYQERLYLEDYWLLDARLLFRQGRQHYFLEATNLTDSRYTGPNLVPMPGRWIRGGVRFRLVG